MLRPLAVGVSTAAGISFVVWIPVELVTPTEIGSSSTQSYGTTIVLERRRPSVCGPSSEYGTIASSTVTVAIVRSSGCGFVTWIRIVPGSNVDPADVELVERRRVVADQAGERAAARREERDRRDKEEDRRERPEAPAGAPALAPPFPRGLARAHQSLTSKKPIQPSSANSDWCAWNMNVPVLWKSISMIPRSPWHCMTVSVYSKWSVEPVG